MKIASKFLAFSVVAGALGLTPNVYAGPSGPSARAAARLKKYPTSAWLAHYLPDDRYKIAGGVWKYVSTDLDTYYHRPDSGLMLNQPAGRVIGFASAAEAEEAGYKPDPSIGSFSAFAMGGALPRAVLSSQRVTLSDGATSITLPGGWRKASGPGVRTQYVTSSSDFFIGPKGERFQVAIINMNLPSTGKNIDMGQFTNVRFFNSLKSNGGLSGGLDRLAQTTGVINSRVSGRNGLSQLTNMKDLKVFGIKLSGIEGVGISSTKKAAGQPGRSYTFGRGHKMWSIVDFSSNQSITPILKTINLR